MAGCSNKGDGDGEWGRLLSGALGGGMESVVDGLVDEGGRVLVVGGEGMS